MEIEGHCLKRIVRFLVECFCRIAGIDIRSLTATGYQEAIAGSDLEDATQVGAHSYSVHLEIKEKERQQLGKLLSNFTSKHDLRFFDFPQGPKRHPMRRMALFSQRGLHVHADMLLRSSSVEEKLPSSPIILVGVTFANHDDWLPILRELDVALQAQFSGKISFSQWTQVEPITVPDLLSWKALPPQERSALLASYPYREEARPLMQSVVDDFRKEHGHIEQLEIDDGPAIYHGGSWVISVRHPFIFDRRELPNQHLGVWVHTSIKGPLPPEFSGQKLPKAYVWAPSNYERFVDRCGDEIRLALRKPTMTRTEILNALIGRPFEEHMTHYLEQVRLGRLPRLE